MTLMTVRLSALLHESKENGTYQEQSLKHYLCLLCGSFHARLTGVLIFHHLVHWQKEKGAAALLGTTLQTALLQNKQTIYF